MIQWNSIPFIMSTPAYNPMPQISYSPLSIFQFIPFGHLTGNYITPNMPTPQGIGTYNPFAFNFSFSSFRNFSFPTLHFPTINYSGIWNGITSTATNLYNSTKKAVSTAVKSVGNLASRIVAGARKYLGFNKADGSYKKFTGGRNEAWCAHFATYVARENGANIPHFSAVSDILSWGQKNGKFSKTPKVGDLVIYKGRDKNGKRVSHTGIVSSVENGKIKTIEGNTSGGKVAERSCSINDSRITGFVSVA